jgi:hypothetical protein
MTSTDHALEIIATALNEAMPAVEGYNHWEHFEALCEANGLEADYETQEAQDILGAYTLYALDADGTPRELILDCGRWSAAV